jgi:hypothetical protein
MIIWDFWDEEDKDIIADYGISMVCNEHAMCGCDGCGAEHTIGIRYADEPFEFRCASHMYGYTKHGTSLLPIIMEISNQLMWIKQKREEVKNENEA